MHLRIERIAHSVEQRQRVRRRTATVKLRKKGVGAANEGRAGPRVSQPFARQLHPMHTGRRLALAEDQPGRYRHVFFGHQPGERVQLGGGVVGQMQRDVQRQTQGARLGGCLAQRGRVIVPVEVQIDAQVVERQDAQALQLGRAQRLAVAGDAQA